jgi:hypothetical protein
MIFVPREQVWPGQKPTNSNGTPRPKLDPLRPYYTIHYTGGGLWLDPDDTADELRSIQEYASSASKGTPWEYNYVVDGQGCVWEYAGDYRAAHSAGENDIAIGVLLLLGFKGKYPDVEYWEEPTAAMIQAVQELRYTLVDRKMLAGAHQMLQHRQMPGAATVCPGTAVVGAWGLLTTPWTPPRPDPIPPTPPDTGDDEMKQNYYVVTGANAKFIGVPPMIHWTGPGDQKMTDAIQKNLDNGTLVLQDITGGPMSFALHFLEGPLPTGDTLYTWTGDEFANTAQIKAGTT